MGGQKKGKSINKSESFLSTLAEASPEGATATATLMDELKSLNLLKGERIMKGRY